MTKKDIINELIRRQRQLVQELQNQKAIIYSSVDIDESDTIDPEDLSHQFEAHEMEHLTDLQLKKAESELERMLQIDTDTDGKIKQGSIVETNNFNFIIGFPALPFSLMDKQFVGVSKDSPIYSLMIHSQKGKSFSYQGNSYTITNIY